MVQKTSSDSLSINGQTFTFDSVADTDASQAWLTSLNIVFLNIWLRLDAHLFFCTSLQLDIFQLVGVPLVENCMAGFNSSVFAYGQVFFYLSSTLLCLCYVSMFMLYHVLYVWYLNLLDGKWKDIHYVGSCKCIVGWKFIKWSTRLNSSCSRASFCSHKWGEF